jgi:hypothetical protein
MCKNLVVVLSLVALCCGTVVTQEKKADPPKAAPADKVKAELSLSAEHVPADLKAGTRVDLKVVTGKTVAPNGRTLYRTFTSVADVEVGSVTKVEKPTNPEEAVKVELLVTKEQAGKIDELKKREATRVEKAPGGGVTTKKAPLTLRLELTVPVKK